LFVVKYLLSQTIAICLLEGYIHKEMLISNLKTRGILNCKIKKYQSEIFYQKKRFFNNLNILDVLDDIELLKELGAILNIRAGIRDFEQAQNKCKFALISLHILFFCF
jgi:hypothetical protein